MRGSSLRTAAASLTLAFALTLGGCAGNSTTSSSSASGVAPSAHSAASSGAYQHGHRRHRRGHRAYGAAAGAAGAVGAAGVAGAVGAAAASAASASGASGASGAYGAHAASKIAIVASAAPSAPTVGSWPCNDSQFVQNQQQFANGTLRGDQEVDVCGTVTQVLAAKTTRSGLHGYYDVQVAPGDTIEIVSDLDQMDAPAWPWVKAGDYSYVQGRYYYDSPFSQGIDWTHHGTSNSWPTAGYVVINGTEYQ